MSTGKRSATPRADRGLYIEDDIPGRWLRLSWYGPEPHSRLRLVSTLVMFLGLAVCVNFAIAAVRAARRDPGDAEVIFLGLLSLMSLMVLGIGAGFVGRLVGYWTELVWDDGLGAFTARRRGWYFWGRDMISIPFSRIDRTGIRLGADTAATLPAKLEIGPTYDSLLRVDLSPLHLADRQEGQNLAFAIARVMRSAGYLIETNTPRELALQFWQSDPFAPDPDDFDEDEQDDGPLGQLLPIPDSDSDAIIAPARRPDYADRVRPGAPLNLANVREALVLTQIDEWNPGQKVTITRPSAPWFLYVIVLGVMAGVSGAVGYWFVWDFASGLARLDDADRPFVAAYTALVACTVISFWLFNNLKRRQVQFNWPRNRLTVHFGETIHEWPLEVIQELLLTDQSHSTSTKSKNRAATATSFGSSLQIVLPHEDVLLIETETEHANIAAARARLAALGSELAAALQVRYSPGKVREPRDAVSKALRLTTAQWLVVVGLGVVAVGLVVPEMLRHQSFGALEKELQTLGVDATIYGSFQRNRNKVADRYLKVRMTDNSLLLTQGEAIRERLLQCPAVGLDLSNSTLTDADLQFFRGVKLCIINLENTRITDSGLAELLRGDDVVYLDLTGTPVTDVSIPAITRLPKLRFLFFHQTAITPEGINRLHRISTLEEVRP